jgi:zinc-ribbon family
MVVIFGFGAGSPEDQGEVAPCVCPNCHNQVLLHHIRSKKSVRLYFVPVVPYGTDNYLVCPVCSRGLQVSDAQLRHVRSMSSATASFRAGRLSQDRYMAQAERFWRQLGVNPAGQQVSTPASPGAPVPVQPAASVRSAAPAPAPPRPRMTRHRGYRTCTSSRSCTARACFPTLPTRPLSGASWNRTSNLSRRGRNHRRPGQLTPDELSKVRRPLQSRHRARPLGAVRPSPHVSQ